MKVLLTGYSGFLGHHLNKALRKEGFSLRVLLHRHTVSRKELETGIEVIWGSIDNTKVIRSAVEGVDYVVHSAWAFSSPFEERPTINERTIDLLFSESVSAGVRKFVFISSVAVYGMSHKNQSPINEFFPLAQGKDLSFIYPSEKINSEEIMHKFSRKHTAIAIFRPGPIFDESKGPAKKVLKIGPCWLGIGIGNGRNQMAYIHAKDVADAIVRWLAKGEDGVIFNVVPSKCLLSKEWIRSWGLRNGFRLWPVFIPGIAVRLAGFVLQIIKRIFGKQGKGNINYVIACAKRDLCYSNESLKQSLCWVDEATSEYTKGN